MLQITCNSIEIRFVSLVHRLNAWFRIYFLSVCASQQHAQIKRPNKYEKSIRFRRWNWMHENYYCCCYHCVYVCAVIQTCKKKNLCDATALSQTELNKTKPKIHLLDLPPAGIVSRKSNAFSNRSMNNKCKLIKQYFCISARTHTIDCPRVPSSTKLHTINRWNITAQTHNMCSTHRQSVEVRSIENCLEIALAWNFRFVFFSFSRSNIRWN